MWTKTGSCVFVAHILCFTISGIGGNPFPELNDSVVNEIALSEDPSTLPKARSLDVPVARQRLMFHVLTPADCEEYLQLGWDATGVYEIWPKNRILKGRPIEVFCNMDIDGGGWTVIQRRDNFLRPIDYFNKDWKSYKEGFGNIEKDFWLGNDNIFALTNQKSYSALFEMMDVNGEDRYAAYDIFYILDETHKYMLTIQDYSGTAGDPMTAMHNGQNFSTYDQDNDNHPGSCAAVYRGGWWYNSCHNANLNGLYLDGEHTHFGSGIIWYPWKGFYESLESTEIMIRSKNFRRKWNQV